MIMASGALAVLQMTVLPGLLLLLFFRIRCASRIAQGLAIAATSLLINYFLVVGLTACGQYKRSHVVILVVAELLALAVLSWRKRNQRQLSDSVPGEMSPATTWQIAAATISLIIIGAHLLDWAGEWPKVFEHFDAIVSWNRWALSWKSNIWPEQTWNYPQLLPANWSLAYVVTGAREGELFARIIMGVFPLMILAALFDLQRRWREPALAASVAAAHLIIEKYFTTAQFDGMADVPVAALSFAGIYFLLQARETERPAALMFLSAAALGAACVTKQGGLLVAGLALVWLLTDKKLRDSARRCGPARWYFLALLLVCALHWYVPRLLLHWQEDSSLARYLTEDIHQGRSYSERVVHGLGLIYHGFRSPVLVWTMVSLLIISLRNPIGARIALNFTVPLLVIWGMIYSYDMRNSACMWPMAALGVGLGAAEVGRCVCACLQWLHRRTPAALKPGAVSIVMIMALLICFCFNADENFSAGFRAARRRAGDEDFNRIIAKNTSDGGRILSSYLQLTIQPGFDKRTTYDRAPLATGPELAQRLVSFPWIVVELTLPADQEEVRNKLISSGVLQRIGSGTTHVLYKNTQLQIPSS